jgi:hypothetical protein
MAKLQDIPAMISSFIDLAKEYLLQETVGAAKKLGRFAGFSLGAALLWAMALILIGVALMRGLVDVMPSGPYWEALGYMAAFVVFVLVAFILTKVGPKAEPQESNGETGGPV